MSTDTALASEQVTEEDHSPRPKKYSRWRAGSLMLVYLAMGAHFAHWKITGKSLAPLELNEVMYTLELGIVTAGFLFMVLALLSVLVFGRFFCSWGCHILALEDLCAWLLGKVGIKPKPVRSRLLLLVPPGALFYMFVWPQIARVARGLPLPKFAIFGDERGWASFITTDFTRNLPGVGIALLTFLVCGFLIVYVLGSRSFCRYGCPYGALFALADKVAPGRIIALGGCTGCGTCTANCQSDIRVHEELAAYGTVMNSACLKDLDCVSVCPSGAIGYGFTRPSLFRSRAVEGRPRKRYSFTIAEELCLAVGFVLAFTVFRGLYGIVPFLLSLAIASICAYLGVITLRLLWRRDVKVNGVLLKIGGQFTELGKAVAMTAVLVGAFVAHSGWIRFHHLAGQAAYASVAHGHTGAVTPVDEHEIAVAIDHLKLVNRWGLVRTPGTDRDLGELYLLAGAPSEAERFLRRALVREPGRLEARFSLARTLYSTGRVDAAVEELNRVLAAEEQNAAAGLASGLRASAHEMLGAIQASKGDFPAAVAAYRTSLQERPANAGAHLALAELFAGEQRFSDAAAHLAAAVRLDPGSAPARFNLAVLLAHLGRQEEAIEHYRAAAQLDPSDPDTHNNLGFLLAAGGDFSGAEASFLRAIALAPKSPDPRLNLGRVLLQTGRRAEAEESLRRAAQLDPTYVDTVTELLTIGARDRIVHDE